MSDDDVLIGTTEATTTSSAGIGLRTVVYIDGLNLYGGLEREFGGRGKWLDIEAFGDRLADGLARRIWYFTSKVRQMGNDPGPKSRQRQYLRVVEGQERVEVVYGYVKREKVRRWPTEPRPEEWPFPRVLDAKEKGSDVALATQLLRDATAGSFDQAIVVTNDSDLAPLIALTVELGHMISIIHPSSRPARSLRATGARCEPLWENTVLKSQLAEAVVLRSGAVVTRPSSWTYDSRPT